MAHVSRARAHSLESTQFTPQNVPPPFVNISERTRLYFTRFQVHSFYT